MQLFNKALSALLGVAKAVKSIWPDDADDTADTPPLWQLVPNQHGTYTLQRWKADLGHYYTEAVLVADEKEAEIIIERLSRPPIIR